MKIIKRKMENTKEPYVIGNDDIDTYLPYCQASFNSDGNITLRNYDRSDKSKDEIIILSESETLAICKLFKEFKKICLNNELPF